MPDPFTREEFLQAAREGDVAFVRQCIRGTDPNRINIAHIYADRAFQEAIRGLHLPVIEALLEIPDINLNLKNFWSGVGPANLHRALKIQAIDPSAKLVFIDNRLNPDTRDIKRDVARANIFRFEIEDVTQKLIDDGVSREELMDLVYEREFSVKQGFQSGDDKVFASKPFTQIQIRDLQLLLNRSQACINILK